MDEATAKALREPFAAELVGKLPRVWCAACRDAKGRVCSQHTKTRCPDCGNTITEAHIDLAYVGHAAVTDRLLQVDPGWSWEPLALDDRGLPALDAAGGLWIKLTIGGTTRLGYGDAPGKRGGDAVKELIGDAIRNASMRFGVAIDLWHKEPPPADETPTTRAARTPRTRRAAEPPVRADDKRERLTKRSFANWRTLGLDGDDKRDQRLTVMSKILGREVTSTNDLSVDELSAVVAEQEQRINSQPREAS
jgi:hypothetical protein